MEVGPCPFCRGTIGISWLGGYYCFSCDRIFKFNGAVVNPRELDPLVRKYHETSHADYRLPKTPVKGERQGVLIGVD